VTESAWAAIGPEPIAAGVTGVGPYPVAGRVTAVAVQDANTAYIGAADGGVWKTTDGGNTWNPLTDGQSSLWIGAIAIDPTNSSILYAGTEEKNFVSDSYGGVAVLTSPNAGASWQQASDAIFSGVRIGRIAVDPLNHTTG
jgi:photosystem II stability/assembly factor-like uncharacterized protein